MLSKAVKVCQSSSYEILEVASKLKAFVAGLLMATVCLGANASTRPPATPLVACDPYFSIWSNTDALNDGTTTHWTGRAHPLTSMIRIDGKAYRLMGAEPTDVPTLQQVSLQVLPTRTIYSFEGSGVRVRMTFMQAALPDDIDLLSRPIVYLTWSCRSIDSQAHNVAVYIDAGMELVVNDRGQWVVWSKPELEGMQVLKAGSDEQNVLQRKGDNVRIDWGYFYLAAADRYAPAAAITSAEACRKAFIDDGAVAPKIDTSMPKKVEDGAPVMAMSFDLGSVGDSRWGSSCRVMLAYDDLYSVLYFGRQLKAYWKRDGKTIEQILKQANEDYRALARRCWSFDRELMNDLEEAGGPDYQYIAALAYRQALGANKIVADINGMPLMFSKECFSNGCMGTVDVFYPFAPQVLLLNPTLAKASFVPILEYGRSSRWRFPFAPHDIGTYPHAMGQVYGGGERTERNQMPVEECGNMILLVAAVVEAENDISFARDYWDVLTTWAEYLKSKGLDPENQLCTDDFAGHLAHNVNLSVKAIVALGAYAKMADMMGEKDTASAYRKTAESYAVQWEKMADDGDHYRLAFDRADTWSQKYNLVWDRILDLDLFDDAIAEKEMAYYRKVQNTYGLPLDNRSKYTKLDWIVWTASITGQKDDFQALIAPIARFLNETPDRVPMTDWYWTHDAKHRGFQARPVVGGVFIRLLDNPDVWARWVKKADSVSGKWLPIPKPPKIIEVVPTSQEAARQWYYTFERPARNWSESTFDPAAAGWKQGPGGLGTRDTPGTSVRTTWSSSDVWLARKFDLKEVRQDLQLMIHHDEDAEVYINGVQIARFSGFTTGYERRPLNKAALEALKKGSNTIAIHCHQTTGGQYIDAGLVRVVEQQ